MHHLLILAARISGDPAYYQELAQTACELIDWAEIPSQAETQGLGPLLYTHLRAAGVRLAPGVKQQLQGLYLRHRRANQVRIRALGEILEAYEVVGIQTLVLKGAALAHLVYPEPGLRPMGDIDLLVKRKEVHQAQRLLAELGFAAYLPSATDLPDKHLLAATKQTDEFPISVEVHYDLFNQGYARPTTLEYLADKAIPFSLPGVTAYTLGYEDMLWHLCQHIAYHTTVWKPVRLIWAADIVGWAERFAMEIDWASVARRYPYILNTLSLLHFISPLSETLRQQAPLKIGRAPSGIGRDFQGWPYSSIGQQREKGYRGILRDSFYPPEWWLRLRYGLGSSSPLFWHRWVRHPLHILGWMIHLLVGRLGWRCM
jgi:hypothetical protein